MRSMAQIKSRPEQVAAAMVMCITVLLAACESPRATQASGGVTAPDTRPAVIWKLVAGQEDYVNVLLSEGWLPLQDLESCRAQAATPAGNPCRNVPGLQGCDVVDGVCRLRFARLENRQTVELQVEARGVGSEAPVLGALRSAEAGPLFRPEMGLPSTECPSRDFRHFLEAFAAQPEIRQGLSAPLLRFEQVVA